MLKHVVLMKWKEGVTEEQIDKVTDGFSDLAQQVDNHIHSYEYGSSAGIYEGDYQYCLVAEFESPEDFQAYIVNDDHQTFMKEIISPVMDSYTAFQFYC